jgi:hypothetical protein
MHRLSRWGGGLSRCDFSQILRSIPLIERRNSKTPVNLDIPFLGSEPEKDS